MLDSFFITLTGVVGLGVNAYSLTRKSDFKLRLLIGIGFLVWAVNNWLLAAHSAAVLCLVAAVRQAAALWVLQKPALKHVSFFIFQMAVLLFSAGTWNGWGTAFACASSTLSTIAMFYLSGARLRLVVAVAYLLWTLTTWVSGAWWGVCANIMLTCAAGYGYFQLAHKQRI